MKVNEIDYKALYEQTISRLKIAKKNVGYYTFSSVIDKVIPELAENEDEGMRKRLLNWFKGCNWDTIDNGTLKRDDIIAWLENLEKRKELKPVEQKATWSEDDEKMWAQVINEIEAIKSNSSTVFEKNVAQDKIDWLKSLKDRMTWRPTEEQMKALGDAIFDAEYDHRLTEMGALLSLDKDLKKL